MLKTWQTTDFKCNLNLNEGQGFNKLNPLPKFIYRTFKKNWNYNLEFETYKKLIDTKLSKDPIMPIMWTIYILMDYLPIFKKTFKQTLKSYWLE